MEILSSQFFSALLAIVIIDLVLAGDNAIVIALAARALPLRLRRRVIVWGTVGAIAVRSLLTVAVVWLLKIPGLLLLGGLALIVIAYRLLLPEETDNEATAGGGAMTFWGALRTVIIADAVMGLDNVLAVAGAAHGSYLLVVLGLLISVPIVIFGSTMMLGLVQRLPIVVYLGAAVLAWTAVKMVTHEPYLTDWFDAYPAVTAALYMLVILGVPYAGFVKNHRKLESRIHARLAQFARQRKVYTAAYAAKRANTMLRVLIPVDGSPNADNAVRHAINEYLKTSEGEIHLLNVQPPFSRHIAAFVAKRDRDAYHREQAHKALQSARQILERFRVPYQTHIALGQRAEVIAETARRLKCHHIVLGTARKNSLTRMLQDSVTNKVLEITTVPVEVVSGGEISKLERYGVPAAIGAGLGILLLALD